MAEKFDSLAMPGVKPMPEPPDPRIIPLDRQTALTHQQVEQVRFGLGDTGPLAQAVMNANVPALAKQLATGAVSCLSTRRPADPVVGQMIYETDTQLTRFWNGSIWVSVSPDSSISQQTTGYTLTLSNQRQIVEMSGGGTLTVPTNASVPFPIAAQVTILQTGASQVTIAGTGGVTVNATPGLKLRTQWSSATLVKRNTDTWVAIGDLAV